MDVLWVFVGNFGMGGMENLGWGFELGSTKQSLAQRRIDSDVSLGRKREGFARRLGEIILESLGLETRHVESSFSK